MPKSAKALTFSATLYKIGINRCVDVPEEISRALGGGRSVPVVVTVNGRAVRTTLLPGSGGAQRLFINSQLRRAAAADAGERIWIALRPDRASREILVPSDVAAALRRSPQAKQAFALITPALRREFLRWVLAARAPETRARRIALGLENIIARTRRKLHPPRRTKPK
ncbi:MAG: YdeI/OmpD-associated family protein [Candidatus Acidiferrales bacterium]